MTSSGYRRKSRLIARLIRAAGLLAAASWLVTPLSAQTLVFSEGFESPTTLSTNWDAVTAGACRAVWPVTTQAHSGSMSLFYDPNNPSWYCAAAGVPYSCCSGPGTGTCDTSGGCHHNFPAMANFYLSFWIYPNANFNACLPNSGDHLWRMYGTNDQVVQFDNITHYWPSGCTATSPLYLEPEPIFSPGTDSTFWSGLTVTRGQWNRVEILFRQGVGTSGSYLMGWVTDNSGRHPWNYNGGAPVTNYNFNGGTVEQFTNFSVVTNYDHHDATTNWYTDDIEVWTDCPPTGAGCSANQGPDTTPPVISAGAPSGSVPAGTTSVTMTVATNEIATCKYSTTAGTAFASMPNTFSVTGGASHSTPISGLTNGGNYTYYVRCRDTSSNADASDYPVAFSVSSASVASSCASPPAGTIFCDDFEDTAGIANRYTDYNTASGRFGPTTSEAHSGTHAMASRFDPGFEDGGGLQLNFGRNPVSSKLASSTDFTELYWRFWMKVQNGWQGNPMKTTRARVIARSDYTDAATGHLWQGSTLNLALDPATGVSTDGTTLMTTGWNDYPDYRWLGIGEGATQVYDASHQGRWQCIEAHMKLNTPGQSDGVFEFWVDGSLDARRTALNFRGSYTAYGINFVTLEDWWNGGAAPQTEYRYFDDFIVSTQRIGCGSTDTVSPSTVNGLRRTDQH